MTKFWCVTLAFGNSKDGGLVLGTRIAPSAEVAVAMTVSQYYVDAPPVRLPLAGIATLELTRELMEAALRQMADDEATPDQIVRLVPRTVSIIDEQNQLVPRVPPERKVILAETEKTAGEHFKEVYGREFDQSKDDST